MIAAIAVSPGLRGRNAKYQVKCWEKKDPPNRKQQRGKEKKNVESINSIAQIRNVKGASIILSLG